MNSPTPLVCLITPGHLASTPRLVKEADALAEAGIRVRVIAGRHYSPADPLDADILGTAAWPCTRVDYRGGAGPFARKVLRRIARLLVVRAPFASGRIAARANHAETLHFARVAAEVPAQLFVGHGLPGLAAAAIAARTRGVAHGFDAEDFHDTETEAVQIDPAERISAHLLQTRFLAGCSHLTAAAPLIGRRYEEAYRVSPLTVLNVFPRSQAPSEPVDPGVVGPGRPAQVYWFSQTIGPGRGLDAVIAILARMRTPAVLSLRGFAAHGYAEHLQTVAARSGLKHPVSFLPPGPPGEMARLAAGADLGLSTEPSLPPNRDICLTNKIFVYLLAGIPQLLSNTSAQSALAPELGAAGLLADLSQTDSVARQLDEFFSNPTRIRAARAAAWELANRRFCWDVEKTRFLESIRAAIPKSP
jgi:glycosyltransferase involved in cell wall biosynthesis